MAAKTAALYSAQVRSTSKQQSCFLKSAEFISADLNQIKGTSHGLPGGEVRQILPWQIKSVFIMCVAPFKICMKTVYTTKSKSGICKSVQLSGANIMTYVMFTNSKS